MAESEAQEVHVFQLSSLDQAAERGYIRYCLCFATPRDAFDMNATTHRLADTLKHTITNLPILAGIVRPKKVEKEEQGGRVEVAVTLKQIQTFEAIVKRLTPEEFPYTYKDLEANGMPPSVLLNDTLTPLPDAMDSPADPVFAIQANFVTDGLIVAMYLHQSVADVIGIQTVIKALSNDPRGYKLTDDDIYEEAIEQSRFRDRLSGSRGVKADVIVRDFAKSGRRSSDASMSTVVEAGPSTASRRTCRVFSFHYKLIEDLTALLNGHNQTLHKDRTAKLTPFSTLAAVVWKGIVRAQDQVKSKSQKNRISTTSSLTIPVDIRKRLEPRLDDSYMGNASINALITTPELNLILPFEAPGLALTASSIATEMAGIGETQVRSTIASINASPTIFSSCTRTPSEGLKISDWTALTLDDAHLGLGLGKPGFGRQLGREIETDGCLVHPAKVGDGVWEVTVEVFEEVGVAMLEDEYFMEFVGKCTWV